jgi:hypothetical protein
MMHCEGSSAGKRAITVPFFRSTVHLHTHTQARPSRAKIKGPFVRC